MNVFKPLSISEIIYLVLSLIYNKNLKGGARHLKFGTEEKVCNTNEYLFNKVT